MLTRSDHQNEWPLTANQPGRVSTHRFDFECGGKIWINFQNNESSSFHCFCRIWLNSCTDTVSVTEKSDTFPCKTAHVSRLATWTRNPSSCLRCRRSHISLTAKIAVLQPLYLSMPPDEKSVIQVAPEAGSSGRSRSPTTSCEQVRFPLSEATRMWPDKSKQSSDALVSGPLLLSLTFPHQYAESQPVAPTGSRSAHRRHWPVFFAGRSSPQEVGDLLALPLHRTLKTPLPIEESNCRGSFIDDRTLKNHSSTSPSWTEATATANRSRLPLILFLFAVTAYAHPDWHDASDYQGLS